jgi:acyl carrier protein
VVSNVTTDSCLDELKMLLGDVLHLGRRAATLSADTRLFGSLPELDSMALISVVLEIEERFGITFDDEEATAATFATVGTLVSVVDRKRSA